MPFAQQRYTEIATILAARLVSDSSKFRIRKNVRQVNCLAFQDNSSGNSSATGHDRVLLGKFHEFIGHATGCRQFEHAVFGTPNGCYIGLAEMHTGLDQRIEHCLQVER